MRQGRGERLFMSRRFLLFFISQNFVSCGAFIQVVALAQLIVGITNSGLLTGFSMICAPLPGVFLSLFAGSLGDRVRPWGLLVAFDILRGAVILLYIFCRTAPSLFFIMTLSGLLDVFYSPSRNKTLTTVLQKDQLLRGNSILNGGYGAVSLVLPALTGFLIGACGVHTAFMIGAACYFMSALALGSLKIEGQPARERRDNCGGIAGGLRYGFGNADIRRAVLTLAAFDFGGVSVNIAFYAFAFDTLKVSASYWGILLSVLYGMNVFAMLFLTRYRNALGRRPFAAANGFLVLTALVWCFYASTRSQNAILAGAAAEGFCTSLGSTLLVTAMLKASRPDYTARVSGVRDLCSCAAKLLGIGLTSVLMTLFSAPVVFAAGASAVLLSVLVQTARPAFIKLRGAHSGRPVKGDAPRE
jgi:DHA3 family macrolide efflux protein-like MFS transporter